MDKYVFVKTLEQPFDKNNKPYTRILDQDGQSWAFFRQEIQFQIGKSYLFTYSLNEKGFPTVEKITPLVNIFVQQALKEVANKNDIKRDLFMSCSYAKDMVCAGKLEATEMFATAESIYNWTNKMADSLMPKTEETK